MASLGESARFLFHFIRHPVATGAVVPSSPHLADRMVEDMGLGEARTVVEIGPGTGAMTGAILREARASAAVLAIELNAAFAEELASKFPRVAVVNDSAENLRRHLESRGRASADAVVSSLPWAGFPQELQDRLLGAILESLRPGGRFSTFAYIHAAWLPPARRFRRRLEAHFGAVDTSPVVWRNLPPAFVYRCRKKER